MQIGQKGLTDEFIENLKKAFNNVENVRINLLKSAGHDKSKVKQYSDEILEKLGRKYTAKIIGFTIITKKWRKNMR